MSYWIVIGCLLGGDGNLPHGDAPALARIIDQRINDRLAAERVPPAERAADAEFLRRISLDLIGRIPTSAEVLEFLGDTNPNKRSLQIDKLLTGGEHARHFARTWRALLLPEAETEPQVRYLQPGFENWLQQRRGDNVGFDHIVRELLAVPIARPGETPEFVLRDLKKPNPIAFIAAKNAEPAKIASSAVRLFLGLRLECAQCHDHPFDRWTRHQFWNQAAFFAGIERKGAGTFNPLVEVTDRRSIKIVETTDTVPALFLDATEPDFAERESPRVRFAEWMTSPRNAYFSRAVVNRVWSQLMGTGLVEAVDDFRDSNPPSHPELLQELADGFASSGFDVTVLMRAICLSETYQRTSRQSHEGQSAPELFAKMAIKPLSGEQFFDSLWLAIGNDESTRGEGNDSEENTLRRRVTAVFSGDGRPGEPETSVAQALALMNGSFVSRAARPESSRRLKRAIEENPNAPARQIESLYLAALSRLPTAEEQRTLIEYYHQVDESSRSARLGDIFWALLNSPEFRWNH